MIHLTGRRWLLSLVFLKCLLGSMFASAELSVNVDRTEISDADLIKLTVRIDNATSSSSPDFRALEQDFEIMQRSGPNQSSRISIVNGRQTSEVYVSWEFRLRPKRLGLLTIPAFRIGSDVSRPIQISVKQQSEAMKRKMSQLVFFETLVDTNETYVQGQILYTVKLYYVENISGDFPAPPNLSDAVVETIENESRYEAVTNGRRYYVLEKRYGIYPQKSGTLTIPAQTFSGYRVGPGFFSTREPVLSRSESHRIEVSPRPGSFPGEHWLPAAELKLEAKWLSGAPNFVVGEPVNRSIEMTAKGVAVSLLPELPAMEVPGVKTYQDPPVEEQAVTTEGINAKQTTVVGIVPTQAGKLELPEIRIPWWNTKTDQLEYAVIPAQTFQVAPSPAAPVVVPTAPQTSTVGNAESHPVATVDIRLWQGLAAGFALLWLATLCLWYFQSRAQRHEVAQASKAIGPETVSAAKALQQLEKACAAGDAMTAQRSLLAWAKHHYPSVQAMQDLAQQCGDSALQQAIKNLEQQMFSPTASGQWHGQDLVSAVKSLKPGNTKSAPGIAALNPA